MSERRSTIPQSVVWYDDKKNCICGRKRSSGNHEKCSQLRQAKFAEENTRLQAKD